MRELERRVVLSVLDRKWREHLYEMDYLREGIYLRAYSQRDPLVEYQREGFEMFASMMEGIKEEAVGFLFNLDVQVEEEEESRTRTRRRSSSRCGSRSPRARCTRTSGPRAWSGRASRRTSPTPRPARTARPRSVAPSPQEDDEFAGVGRNDKCPCGSGKKYKQCHGRPGGPTGLTARIS